MDSLPNYKCLDSIIPNYQKVSKGQIWQKMPIIPLSFVIFQLKKKKKLKKKTKNIIKKLKN
jgi:hypothetical protein